MIAAKRHKRRKKEMITQKEIFQLCDQAICDDIRPHPGPLPQERENHSPRFEQYQCAGLSCGLWPMTQNRRQQRRSRKLSSAVTLLPLSLGERAGARASVNAKIMFYQKQFNFAAFVLFCG